MEPKADFGLIGLAVMGQNLVLNMNDHGFTVAVFNRTVSKVDEFINGNAQGTKVIGTHSIEEFVSMRDGIAREPQGGAAAMVVALLLLAENEELGRQCLAATLDSSRLDEGAQGYDGMQLRSSDLRLAASQIVGSGHILRSYFQWAALENGYELPDPPHELEFSANEHSGDPAPGTYKVFVSCSGAASARPVTVRQDEGGTWRALEWSSLIVGVQAPAA